MKFILWDPKDGEPRRTDDGKIDSDGIIGRVGQDNVYVTTYAHYDDGTQRSELGHGAPALEVGEFAMATFSLSGSKGRYRVYRVE